MAFSTVPRLLLAKDHTPSPFPSPPSPLRPSVVVIIGVLTTMFSLTFLLLLYAKHCKRQVTTSNPYNTSSSFSADRRNSGVDRSVVDSLPVFRFGSLTGQRQGLECAVCLNRFEPTELLRLLPKCKHGFHVECVDIWLEAHSTCPLCRVRVQPEDVLLVFEPEPEPDKVADAPAPVSLPLPRRVSGRHSSAGENRTKAAQVVLNRRSEGGGGTGVSVGCFERVRKDGLLLTESAAEKREEFERRFSHRIIVSGGDGARERWSDLKPSDLLYLRSEMIVRDNARVSDSGRVVNSLRSVSEITGVSRFREEEEQTVKRWLGFRPKRTGWWQANEPRT